MVKGVRVREWPAGGEWHNAKRGQAAPRPSWLCAAVQKACACARTDQSRRRGIVEMPAGNSTYSQVELKANTPPRAVLTRGVCSKGVYAQDKMCVHARQGKGRKVR